MIALRTRKLELKVEKLERQFDILTKQLNDLVDCYHRLVDGIENKEKVLFGFTAIESLELSNRTINALINGGVDSLEKLKRTSLPKLSNFRGLGKAGLEEIKHFLYEDEL